VLKRWTDIASAAKASIPNLTTDRKKVADRLREEAKKQGKHMTPGTATLLVEMTGGSLTIGMAELEKAILFAGKADSVRDADVRAAVAPETEYNVYQLVDAIIAGDSGAALKQLRILSGTKDKIEGQTFSRIFPTIARQFRVVWQARLCIEGDCRASDPSPQVLAMLASKPRIQDERDWSQQRAMRAARRLSLHQISQVFHELGEADARLKGMGASYSSVETVEQMVLRMSAACRG
jgi:DNA polymerase-3 subunit delta